MINILFSEKNVNIQPAICQSYECLSLSHLLTCTGRHILSLIIIFCILGDLTPIDEHAKKMNRDEEHDN